MNVINLTTHQITDALTGRVYKPSGRVLRADSRTELQSGYGVQVARYEYFLPEGAELPPELPDTLYIVSSMALNAIPAHRTDFIAPGPVEKDQDGRPFACRGFRR